MALTQKQAGLKYGFKSGLEETVSKQIEKAGLVVNYESMVIEYYKPLTDHKYKPDFALPNGIIIETKGRFLLADRKKHLLIQKQRYDLDIRFVFSNSRQRISKTSNTSYGDWCKKNGFKFADKVIPLTWLHE